MSTRWLARIFLAFLETLVIFRYASVHCRVLNYDSVTVCENDNRIIQCPQQESIHVLQGFYGKWSNHDCRGRLPAPDNLKTCSVPRNRSTAIVRDLCQGKRTCNLFADDSIFGKACSSLKKYLYVTYFCMAQGQKLAHRKTELNEEVVTVPSHGHIIGESQAPSTYSEGRSLAPNIEKVIVFKEPEIDQSVFGQDKVEDNSAGSGGRDRVLSVPIDKLDEASRSLSLVEGEHAQKSVLPSLEDIRKTLDGKVAKDLRSTTICNGQSKLLVCLANEALKINYAFYGKRTGRDCKGELPYKDESPTCSALDARKNVEASCNGKQSCLLFADENVFGKSLCPNVNKYLYLTYFCTDLPKDIPDLRGMLTPEEDLEEDAVSRSGIGNKSNPMEDHAVQICNGERRSISCKENEIIKVKSAFYGKRNGSDCRRLITYRDDIPDCFNPRATDSIKFLCSNRRSCELAAEAALFGDDVCPGVNKYLQVHFVCK